MIVIVSGPLPGVFVIALMIDPAGQTIKSMTRPDSNIDASSDPEQAVRFLRRHTTGVLLVDDLIEPVRYAVDAQGAVVSVVPGHAFEGESLTLCIPIDDAEESLQLLVEIVLIDPESALADRWKAYHGRPQGGAPVRFRILSAKFKGTVIEKTKLDLTNALGQVESRICRTANRNHPDRLKSTCQSRCNLATRNPVLVGIDPLGCDIRAHAGVVRIESAHPLTTIDEALTFLNLPLDDHKESRVK